MVINGQAVNCNLASSICFAVALNPLQLYYEHTLGLFALQSSYIHFYLLWSINSGQQPHQRFMVQLLAKYLPSNHTLHQNPFYQPTSHRCIAIETKARVISCSLHTSFIAAQVSALSKLLLSFHLLPPPFTWF